MAAGRKESQDLVGPKDAAQKALVEKPELKERIKAAIMAKREAQVPSA